MIKSIIIIIILWRLPARTGPLTTEKPIQSPNQITSPCTPRVQTCQLWKRGSNARFTSSGPPVGRNSAEINDTAMSVYASSMESWQSRDRSSKPYHCVPHYLLDPPPPPRHRRSETDILFVAMISSGLGLGALEYVSVLLAS